MALTLFKTRQYFASKIIIGLVLIASMYGKMYDGINIELNKIHSDFEENKVIAKLYLEYCLERVTDRKQCLFSKPFFLLRKQESLDVSNDLGKKYLGTQHYLDFYNKLSQRDSEIKRLPSFKNFIVLEEEQLAKAYKIHKKYNVFSKGNISGVSFLVSLVSTFGLVEMIWLILLFYFFGPKLEGVYGTKRFAFYVILGAGLGIFIRIFSAHDDSIEFIQGAGFLACTILGLFWCRFNKLSFYHIFSVFIGEKINFRVRESLVFILMFFLISEQLFYSSTGGVQYYLLSFMFSAIIDLLDRKMTKLPSGFVEKKSYEKWKWVKSNNDPLFIFNQALEILKYNPFALKIKQELLEILSNEFETELDKKNAYLPLIDRFVFYLVLESEGAFREDLESLWRCVSILPYHFDFQKYFQKKDLGKLRLLVMHGVRKKDQSIYLLKFLESYLLLNGSWGEIKKEDMVIIFDDLNLGVEERKYLDYLAKSSRSLIFRDFINYIADNLSLDSKI